MRREENDINGRVMNMNVEGWRGRGRPKKDGLTVWGRIWERWLWVMKWRVIEENGGRRLATPTPSDLGKRQEEEEGKYTIHKKNLLSLQTGRIGIITIIMY
jgi:hypothetical protein